MNLILYKQEYKNESMDRFIDNLEYLQLQSFASELLEYGFDDLDEIEQAVERAINVCQVASIPVNKHFRIIYIDDHGVITHDWKISPLAMNLVLINGKPNNPIVARNQLNLLRKRKKYAEAE